MKNQKNFLCAMIFIMIFSFSVISCNDDSSNTYNNPSEDDTESEASSEKENTSTDNTSEDEDSDTITVSKIKVTRGQNYPPYHYIDKDGNLKGLCVEIVNEVCSSMGIDVEYEQNPWSRCIHLVKTGKIDAMMNLFKTKEREGFMIFYDNILAYEINAIWTHKDNNISYTGDIAKEIGDGSIGVVKDYSYGDKFDSIKNQLNIDDTSTNESMLVKKLSSKRLDYIIGNKLVINWLANEQGVLNDIVQLEPVVSIGGLYIGFSKENSETLDSVAKTFSEKLKEFKGTDKYNTIVEKYN